MSYAKHNSVFHSTTKNGKQNGWYQSYTTETKQQKGSFLYNYQHLPKKPVPFWFPKGGRNGVVFAEDLKISSMKAPTKMDGWNTMKSGQFMVNPNLNWRPCWVGRKPYNHYLLEWIWRVGCYKLTRWNFIVNCNGFCCPRFRGYTSIPVRFRERISLHDSTTQPPGKPKSFVGCLDNLEKTKQKRCVKICMMCLK